MSSLIERDADALQGFDIDTLDHITEFLLLDDLINLKKVCWGMRHVVRGIYNNNKPLPPKRDYTGLLNKELWENIVDYLSVRELRSLSVVSKSFNKNLSEKASKFVTVFIPNRSFHFVSNGSAGKHWC
jgi:hypothetical protein